MKVGLAAQTGEAGPGGTQVVPPQAKPPPTLAEVARLFPQLEILECLGCGGMGAVYKARQPRLDRFVALKILTRDREDTTRDARFVERFEREARALAKLSHPNIVAMYEFGQVEGLPYFIMEYVDGLNVRQLEQARKLAPREALEIIPQICEALQFAHDEGIVHRDIKPANILLDKKGRVKIADFGIAKIMGGTPLIASDAEKLATKSGAGLTQDQVLGTPDYMAPEQVEHPQTVDHRADIYSLGVVFYEMLTGELPLGKFQPPSRKVQIDVRLDEIVLHALEKEPERRYQEASQVKRDVETVSAQTPPVALSGDAAEGAAAETWTEARRQVKAPALGLVITSISGPFVVGILAQTGYLNVGAWMFWPFVVQLGLTVAAAYGAMKAMRLESHRSAMMGGIAGCVLSFLNLLCLPFAVWLLAVLTRDHIRRAFSSSRHRSSTRGPVCVLAEKGKPAGITRVLGHRFAGKRWFAIAGGSLMLVAFFVGVLFWPSGILSRPNLSPGADAALLARSEALRLQGNGPAEVADLSSRLITQQDLQALAAKPRLKRLDLHDSSIDDEDLRILANLKALEWLDLSATLASTEYKPRITDAGLRHLRSLSRLRTLILHGLPVTDAGLEQLKSLSGLERLQLGGTLVTGEGLRHLTNLNWVRLDATPITDEGLRNLQATVGLEELYLDQTKVGNAGLRHLVGLRKLRTLNLHDTEVTPGGMAFLKKHLPALTVGVNQPAEPPQAGFGPMREVTLSDMDDLRGGEAVDLDSGRLLDLPKDTEKRPESEPFQWLKEHSVDVLLDNVDGRWGLLTTTDNEMKLAPLPNEKWEAVTERELSQALAAEPSGLEIKQRGSWTVYVLATNAQPPLTFAFRTASGARGVLQIMRFGEKPNSARLRYKLVQPAATVLASPREVVTEWLRRVKAGTREAWDLTTHSDNVGWGPSFTGLWEYDRIRPLHQLGDEEQAMVLSNPFKDNAGQPRIFCAVLRQRAGQWRVDHHTYVSPSEASSLMKGFSLNPGMKFDVLAAELVGEWRAECDSTISMAADGTGTQLRVGPGGPEPGAQPESFKWEVGGSTLRRHFADRQASLEILWVDDNDLQFHSPNESGWGAWWRKPQVDRHQPSSATNEAPQPTEKAAAIQSKSELSFGPVIERDLGLGTNSTAECFDLDHGVLRKVPRDSLYGDVDRNRLREVGADLFAVWSRRRIHALDMNLVRREAAAWDLPASEVAEAVAGSGATRLEEEVEPDQAPATYAFRTREGGVGLLQLEATPAEPHAVKVRYKLAHVDAVRQTPTEYETVPVSRGALTMVVLEAGKLRPASDHPSQWQIDASVPETSVVHIEVGQDVDCLADAFPDRIFKGKVVRIDDEPVPGTATFNAVVQVTDPGLKFRRGMSVRLSFIIAHRQNALRIPSRALWFRMSGSPTVSTDSPFGLSPNELAMPDAAERAARTVWVMRGQNPPERVRIRIGITDGTLTEVVEGLNEGERVVIARNAPTPEVQATDSPARPTGGPPQAATPGARSQ